MYIFINASSIAASVTSEPVARLGVTSGEQVRSGHQQPPSDLRSAEGRRGEEEICRLCQGPRLPKQRHFGTPHGVD